MRVNLSGRGSRVLHSTSCYGLADRSSDCCRKVSLRSLLFCLYLVLSSLLHCSPRYDWCAGVLLSCSTCPRNGSSIPAAAGGSSCRDIVASSRAISIRTTSGSPPLALPLALPDSSISQPATYENNFESAYPFHRCLCTHISLLDWKWE